MTILRIAKEVIKLTGLKSKIDFLPMPPDDPRKGRLATMSEFNCEPVARLLPIGRRVRTLHAESRGAICY